MQAVERRITNIHDQAYVNLGFIVVWDVLSLRGDDPCLPEQKRTYYSWDIHSWLTFVKSRQIVPKTLFR